jgi:hypothetical protein
VTVAGRAAGQQDVDELRVFNFTKLPSSTNHEKKWSTEPSKNSSIDDFTFLKSILPPVPRKQFSFRSLGVRGSLNILKMLNNYTTFFSVTNPI